MGRLGLDRASLASFDTASAREWLVTNGLGGFASGTVSGARTRRYHGLLVASLRPPVERIVTLAKIDVVASYDGRQYALGANEYADGTRDPGGYLLLQSFELDRGMPVWTYAIGDALLEQRIWMAQGLNTTYVRFTALRASAPLQLELTPLCTYRDYHAHWRGGGSPQVDAAERACSIRFHERASSYQLTIEGGRFAAGAAWHWNHHHRAESARGLDDVEDLFRPGVFMATLPPGRSVTLTATAEAAVPLTADRALAVEQARIEALEGRAPKHAPAWIRELYRAADQFIVRRAGGDASGTTVIAGYPWFSDWGRDTMIALPGLTLTTGRFSEAASILRTFGRHVSEGMLPNRFPDGGETPEYNTVDATLWYFNAIHSYTEASGDIELARELYPVLKEIIGWHVRGTRYAIHVDPADGLLYAGVPGVQLTWMDARVGDWVVTPRIGKPIEINALWYNALEVMVGLARRVKDRTAEKRFAALSARSRDSLRTRFPIPAGRGLYDVIDVPEGASRNDASLRPNQIFAVSLTNSAFGPEVARSIVDTCARELWTPVGLRSLAVGDPSYRGRYAGGPRERDGAYHQGTVWSWLLGPFARAHYRAYGDALRARSFLDGIAGHLHDTALGTVSEVFDGDAPHAPEGCVAQAWSVAEVLGAWVELDRAARAARPVPREESA